MSEVIHDPFEMVYCDNPGCRVNTFEVGNLPLLGCPACPDPGHPIPVRYRG